MASVPSTPGIHLQNLVLDESFTAEQKADCLKVLKLMIKNLADPVKAHTKYRSIKLSNSKFQQNVLPILSAMAYLAAIGFSKATQSPDSVEVLMVENPDVTVMKASLQEVTNALDMVQPSSNSDTTRPRLAATLEEEKKSDDAVIGQRSTERLSEKQKARLLVEQKEQREKDEARQHRAKTSALIKQDKYVRQNDPNWKSGVSAAAAKSGDGISTFRDRHGEH